MQNRYAGDVGDFGKLGMLRCMENSGLNIGINWYLVEDESHNNDGKHIEYLKDERYIGCDDELLIALNEMLKNNSRTVANLEELHLLETEKYYHEVLYGPKHGCMSRSKWHRNGLHEMQDCDLVFLDPDNGLLTKSVGHGSEKSVKYVFPNEIVDYYKTGHSVVFYSHRTREQLAVYLKRFDELFSKEELGNAIIKGVSFKRGTIRDYFFIVHREHVERVESGLKKVLEGKWSRHFNGIEMAEKLMLKYY